MKQVLLFAWLFLSLLAGPVLALEWPHIKTKKIGPNTYVIEHGPHNEDPKISHGFHNNPGFVVTKTGVVVIDTGSSYEISKMILRRIQRITDKPITHIFTTHIHGDHWLANQALVEAYPEALTVAHPELITLLRAGEDKFWIERFEERLGKQAFAGTKAVIPNTPADDRDYNIGGITFRVMLFEKAHTATDLMVHVVEEAVLFTGDVVNNEHFSFMGHGDFKGAYEATERIKNIKARHVVVGHGHGGQMNLVNEFNNIYKTLLTSAHKYYDEGMMDFEMKPRIIADMAKYKSWSGFDDQIGRYISQLITELEREGF